MSNITSLKDLVGKRFRLKETLSKDNVMVSNHTLYIRSNNGEIIANYYYGNDSISTVNFYVGYDRYNVSALILNGNSIYNFYKNVYNEDYGNKPRIVEFLDFDINNIICGGWFGSETATDELAISYFINFWNYNTEEVNIDEALSDIGNSIRNISGKNDKIPFLKMSYELEEGLKKYVKPEGKINITNTEEIDVTQYEKAQVVDENLKAENIAEGVEVLGITGTMKGAGADKLKLWLDLKKNCDNMFSSTSITDASVYLDYNDTENVTSMISMFASCRSLTTVLELNTTNVTNMSYMFHNCSSLTTILELDTSSVTNMSFMFASCSNLTTIPLLNTSSVTNMGNIFDGCSSLTSIPQLDTSKVTKMNNMFNNCSNLTSIPLLNTSSVTSMNNMFARIRALTTIPPLDTSSVTDISYMFYNCYNLTSIPLLNTSSVTSMSYMFYRCENLSKIDITYYNTSSTSYSSRWCNHCYLLKAIIIRSFGSSYTLNSNAFDYCYHLLGTTNSQYNPTGAKDGYIYVPRNMVDTLKSATNWSTHADQIRALEDYTVDGTTTGAFDDAKAGL